MNDRVPRAATLGLFVAWLVHDAEELVTMPGWAARNRSRLRKRFPSVPERVWDRLDVSRPRATLAIGFMGCLVAAAAVSGDRAGGRGALYGSVLAGFGWHGLVHLAQAAAVGRYTPGVATAPAVVAYSAWAWRRLRRAGVQQAATPSWSSLAWFPVAVVAAHGAASAVERALPRWRRR
ncbi:HXXEE domain-containing protein [Amycolatopsis suaedae]|uniref:HXXEE domain-containing protein n=1 Tax=Amycolatopsis suaedae TaxID=2510978 RepID=A0A4Q7IY87_9PSEU|nr:HXXEE domain-containing protein [Amycolatopsis suaedae]RZQ59397.1 HXXEE domain-containing protein [Amycolatopsis suaedae]